MDDITIRPIDSAVRASPYVAPKDRLLGDTAVKYIYIQPIVISVRQTSDFERIMHHIQVASHYKLIIDSQEQPRPCKRVHFFAQ